MFDQEDGELNVVMGVLFGVIALVIAFVIGLGVHSMNRSGAASTAVETLEGGVEVIYAEVEEVGEPMLKIYFESGVTGLPADAVEALAPVLAELETRADALVLLSGFHDETGAADVNAEVAKNRALSVREALLAAGVPPERVLMRRPAVALGGSDADEARRVEVRVQ
ncbi:MAG: OmpA family protein [Azoarcus sp.]|nr:OmpA family protein [Azoarcus sp.]